MPNGECLIVLTALRFSEEFGEAALASAGEREERVVFCLVVDREMSEAVGDQLADTGFVGEKLKHALHEAMVSEYRGRGLSHLEELVRLAREMGIEAESRVLDGAFVDSVLEVARERNVSRILVAALNGPRLVRAIFGSEIRRLRKRALCPVEVFPWTKPRPGPAGRS